MFNLKYRGAAYFYNPAQPIADVAPVSLRYRGVRYQSSNQPALASDALLKYRGVPYRLGQSGQPVEVSQSQPVSRRAESRRARMRSIHQQSLLKNVQRRIEVAQKRGDDRLLALLLAEREQLAA